jgi:hypothetical protein
VAESALRSGTRQRRTSRARAAVAYIAVIANRIPGKDVAQALGVSRSAISRALARGASVATAEGLEIGSRSCSKGRVSPSRKIN